MTLGEYEKGLRVQGDSYKQMVLALRAFANEVLFDDDTRTVLATGAVRCGRRMTPSSKNRRSANTDVTPDLVVQRSATYGVVAECQWGVHRVEAIFAKQAQEKVEQLEKYDDDLTGWPLHPNGDGIVANHDLVLLVNHEDSKRVAKELDSRRQQGGMRIDRNFAVIGIGQFQRADGIWPELDLETGKLSDAAKTDKLSNRLPINPAKLASNPHLSLVELCDDAPPLPVMMELVHRAIIPHLSPDENEQHRLEGEVRKTVALGDLCEWVGEFAFKKADTRDPACPQEAWVADAMATLVAMKWAEKVAGKKDEWVYIHKKGRKSPYSRFVKFCAKKSLHAEQKTRKAKERESAREAKRRERDEQRAAKKREREEQKKGRQLEREMAAAPLFAEHMAKAASAPGARTPASTKKQSRSGQQEQKR